MRDFKEVARLSLCERVVEITQQDGSILYRRQRYGRRCQGADSPGWHFTHGPQYTSLPCAVAAREDITDRRTAAEQESQQRFHRLRALAGELTLVEQRELRRLAKVLHDHVQQMLVAAKFRVSTLEGKGGPEISGDIAKIDQLLSESLSLCRTLTAELSPPVLHEEGLLPGLQWLVLYISDKYDLAVTILDGAVNPLLLDDMAVLLFESVRELLLNVVKHAATRFVSIQLTLKDNDLALSVRDKGCGFDAGEFQSHNGKSGFGLISIRERLELMSGHMEIVSAPGEGTCVTLTVPKDTCLRDARPSPVVTATRSFPATQMTAAK